MDIVEELEKLNELRKDGAVSEQEFQETKEALLAKNHLEEKPVAAGMSQADENMWGMFIHLSKFSGYFVPIAGWVIPIVLWQIKKDESELLDRQGRIVTNWLLSQFIYTIICVLLVFVLIGIPLLIALILVGTIFPIIGAIKANSGESWPYPCSIKFFKIG